MEVLPYSGVKNGFPCKKCGCLTEHTMSKDGIPVCTQCNSAIISKQDFKRVEYALNKTRLVQKETRLFNKVIVMSVEVDDQQIKSLYENDKLSCFSISKKLHVSEYLVWSRLNRMGVKLRKKGSHNGGVSE